MASRRGKAAVRFTDTGWTPPESAVLAACIALCKVHPRVAWAERMNTGAARYHNAAGRERFVMFGFKGLSDILGQMRDGRLLAVEVKAPGGRIRPDQERFIAKVAGNGGVAVIVFSVDQLLRVLNEA